MSRIHRRSGSAVVQYLSLIEFTPDIAVIAGVGCHSGEVECLLEEYPDIELYGFEPHPSTFKAISKTFPGRLFQLALSNEVKKQILYGKSKHKDGASLFPKIIEKDRLECKEFEVQCTTLDETLFFDKVPPLSNRNGILWLDCEGNESSALCGGKGFIEQCISVINCEMTGKPRSIGWCKPVDVHKILTEYGFLLSWSHTHRSTCGQYDAIYLRKEIFRPEYCSSPASILEYEKLNGN